MLAKPAASPAEADRLRGVVLDFVRGKAGQDFLKGLALTGLVPADERQMKRADAYLKETRKGLTP
jgi:hypothetical protein